MRWELNFQNPGRTYRFFTGTSVLPFGFGLAYTTWQYDTTTNPGFVSLRRLQLLLQSAKHGFVSMTNAKEAGPATRFTVNVTNTGTFDSDDVVLGFLTPPGAGKNG